MPRCLGTDEESFNGEAFVVLSNLFTYTLIYFFYFCFVAYFLILFLVFMFPGGSPFPFPVATQAAPTSTLSPSLQTQNASQPPVTVEAFGSLNVDAYWVLL